VGRFFLSIARKAEADRGAAFKPRRIDGLAGIVTPDGM
jgi:hypothetical protein